MTLLPNEQEEWRRLFLQGNERACRVVTNDNGWTALLPKEKIRWYLGKEKGYVQNR
jgi:hypothetical protein